MQHPALTAADIFRYRLLPAGARDRQKTTGPIRNPDIAPASVSSGCGCSAELLPDIRRIVKFAGITATAPKGAVLRERPHIIVVGASAGGVEALQTLVSGLPRDLPAAVFVVLHTGPFDSHVAPVLNRNGNMTVKYASEATPISEGRIYVAPPNLHLRLQNQHMWLDSGPKVNRSRPAIDPLFESAAESYGSRVIGVLLTGHLDDGSAGLAAIKKHGGIAIVQDPKEAYAPEMPLSAMRLFKVDYCLPMSEIAPLLRKLVETKGTDERNVNRQVED